MRMRTITPLIAALVMSGCALASANGSFVADLPEKDAVPISTRIAELAAQRLPRGAKILVVPAASDNAATKDVAARLDEALRARGLAIAGEREAGDSHALRYEVTQYGGAWLVRVHLDDAEATTMMTRKRDGVLIATSPLTVREATR